MVQHGSSHWNRKHHQITTFLEADQPLRPCADDTWGHDRHGCHGRHGQGQPMISTVNLLGKPWKAINIINIINIRPYFDGLHIHYEHFRCRNLRKSSKSSAVLRVAKDTQWFSQGFVLTNRACSSHSAKLDKQSMHNTAELQLRKGFDNLTILCKVSPGHYKRTHWNQSSCVGTRVPAGNSGFQLADSTLHWFHIARTWCGEVFKKSLSCKLWPQVMEPIILKVFVFNLLFFLDAWPRSLWKQDSQQPSTLQCASSICADNRRKRNMEKEAQQECEARQDPTPHNKTRANWVIPQNISTTSQI